MTIMSWCSVISQNSTFFVMFGANFLDSASVDAKPFFYFSAIDIEPEISLEIETIYIVGSNAFDPKEKFEV